MSLSCIFTNICPSSGCTNPCTSLSLIYSPPPIPVPTVTYRQELSPFAAPSFASANAAALTSVSSFTGIFNAFLNSGIKGKSLHGSFGVVLMYPKCSELGFRSIGPKLPIPKDTTLLSLKYSISLGIVTSGLSVLMDTLSSIVPCSSNVAQTIFVPPASNAPYIILCSF